MKNKKWRNIEKRVYETLGVNIFRKYVLFMIEKIIKVNVYRIQNKTVDGIKDYKLFSKIYAISHTFYLILFFNIEVSSFLEFLIWILAIMVNSYCVMTQRYNHIRINETIEKYEELMKRREERKQQEQTNELTYTKEIEHHNENVKEELNSSEKLKELYDMKEFFERENNTMSQSEDNSHQKGLKFKS